MKITNKEIEDIIQFKNNMIKILKEPRNEAKKSWKKLSINDLLILLDLQVEELFDLFETVRYDETNFYKDIMKECCDIANYAFMIYNNIYENLKEEEFSKKVIENPELKGLLDEK